MLRENLLMELFTELFIEIWIVRTEIFRSYIAEKLFITKRFCLFLLHWREMYPEKYESAYNVWS